MRAWTRQHPDVLRTLETTGLYRTDEAAIRAKNGEMADYYLELYRWYVSRGGQVVPVPEGVRFPIWISLTEEVMLQPVEGTVMLELEIPDELVLITDAEGWGCRVNYWYLPQNAEDGRRHEAELKRYGIASESALIQTEKGNFYPALRRKITDSWDRLFTQPPVDLSRAQGTVWELRAHWLRGVILGG